MFGKDAECSSVEATSLLFSAGAEPRRPGLCAQRSCTPLLCKLKADRMSAWRTSRKASVPCCWRKSFLGSRLFKPTVLGVHGGSLRSLDFVRD